MSILLNLNCYGILLLISNRLYNPLEELTKSIFLSCGKNRATIVSGPLNCGK